MKQSAHIEMKHTESRQTERTQIETGGGQKITQTDRIVLSCSKTHYIFESDLYLSSLDSTIQVIKGKLQLNCLSTTTHLISSHVSWCVCALLSTWLNDCLELCGLSVNEWVKDGRRRRTIDETKMKRTKCASFSNWSAGSARKTIKQKERGTEKQNERQWNRHNGGNKNEENNEHNLCNECVWNKYTH